MTIRMSVWSAGKILVLGSGLLATYLLFAAAGMRIALVTSEVKIPPLSGRTVNDATATLGALGLSLRVEESRRLDPKIPSGHIVQQDPEAGSVARRNRSVKVWLSGGPRVTTIPTLVGETDRTAQVRLSQEGLTLTSVAEIRSNDYPTGIVVAQAPPPNARSDRVALLVNRGEQAASYVMPDLIGVEGERAAASLRGAGFRVAVVASQPYPGVPAGVVLRQSPQAGFQIAPGEPISLEISR